MYFNLCSSGVPKPAYVYINYRTTTAYKNRKCGSKDQNPILTYDINQTAYFPSMMVH